MGLFYLNYIAEPVEFGEPAPVEQVETIKRTKSFKLSHRAKTHILYGDRSGGGHKFGIGKPCKSEFPQEWDEQEIIQAVEHIAANDNIDWHKQKNGYFITNQKYEKLQIRVVMSADKTEVITAYPTNVQRNYCPPKPANDN